MIFCWSSSGSDVNKLGEVGRVGQSFGMRVVGAHHDRVGVAEVVDDLGDVVLGVRRDADVATEDLARALRERAADPRAVAAHPAALVHVAHEVRHPRGAELRRQHHEVREPAEHVVEDERRERVLDRSLAVGVLPLPRRHVPRRRDGVVSPRRCDVLVVPVLHDVERDDRRPLPRSAPRAGRSRGRRASGRTRARSGTARRVRRGRARARARRPSGRGRGTTAARSARCARRRSPTSRRTSG